jgi:hypothetical protein
MIATTMTAATKTAATFTPSRLDDLDRKLQRAPRPGTLERDHRDDEERRDRPRGARDPHRDLARER